MITSTTAIGYLDVDIKTSVYNNSKLQSTTSASSLAFTLLPL
jgi:hypothetical protein